MNANNQITKYEHEQYAPAIWERHPTMDDWTLIHNHFELRGYRGKKYDGTVTDIYGWVKKILHGPDAGKYRAGHPKLYDPETDTDAIDLGVFDDLETAMNILVDSNHPSCGVYC